MRIDLTPEQRRLRDELREYFAGLVTPAYQAETATSEGGGPEYFRVLRQMGRDGWLGIGWPREYGGQGRSAIEQFLFFDEAMYAGVNVPTLTINAVAPTVMQRATEEQKQTILPRILRGEMHFAIGYSEPSAGTDLAALTTKAVRDGDQWVINGSKIFTSQAEYADYIWLAARTNPSAAKHKGLSIFMVPTSSPGYKCTPIITMGGFRTNATYYEDVRVPLDHLIGTQDEGWWLIVTQLNHERVSLMTCGLVQRLLEDTVRWAKETVRADGTRVIDQPWVQQNLARLRARIEVLRLVNWKQAWALGQGGLNYADASVVKVFGSEFYVEAYRLLLEVLGAAGAIRDGSPDAVLRGRAERLYRGHAPILTFGGGTNEVQRDIIAMAGLAMPRSKY
ncbi:MAG: acyl-CoA dehydrogenase family protein [Candidatus Binatia bacterium]